MPQNLTVPLPGKLLAVKVFGTSPTAGLAGSADAAESTPQQMQVVLEDEIAKSKQARRALENALEQVGQLQVQLLKDAEQQLLQLSVDIAQKILAQEIQTQQYQIEPIVKEALQHAPPRTDVVVHLHPDDYAQCEMARQAETNGQSGGITFLADPKVNRAESVLETSEGTVESRIDRHLEKIVEAFKNPE